VEICRNNFLFRTLLRKAVASAEILANSAKSKFLASLPQVRPSDIDFWLPVSNLNSVMKDPTSYVDLTGVKGPQCLVNQSAKWLLAVTSALAGRKVMLHPSVVCFHMIRLTELLADPINGFLKAKNFEEALRRSIQSRDFKDLPDLIASPEPSVLIQASAISQKQHQRSGKLQIQKNAVCFSFEKKGVCNKGVNCPFMHQARAERESHQAKSNLQQGAIQGEKESKKLKTDVGDKVKEEWSW
jgi:hypothetical protein